MDKRLLYSLLSVLALCTASKAQIFEPETPEYVVVKNEDDFEIRFYNETTWAVSTVESFSFTSATQSGFHKLFEYIQGANLNWTRVPMTAPVLTGIVPSAGPFCSSAFAVRFYIPARFRSAPPTPLQELGLTFERWVNRTVAVRTFSGYANDDSVIDQAEKLAASLEKSDIAKHATYPVEGEDAYAIAQYSSPIQIFNRKNEVWVNLKLKKDSTLLASL